MRSFGAFAIEEQYVVHLLELTSRRWPPPISPNHFIAKAGGTKKRVEQNLQVMTRSRIAMQVQRAFGLEHTPQFDEAYGHHAQVGHDIAFTQELLQRTDRTCNFHVGAMLVTIAPTERRDPLLLEILGIVREQLEMRQRPSPTAHLEDAYAYTFDRDLERHVSNIFKHIALSLPEDWILDALSIAHTIHDFYARHESLVVLGMRLPAAERQQLAESLLNAEISLPQHMSGEDLRSWRARILAPLLAEPHRSDVLARYAEPNPIGSLTTGIEQFANRNSDLTQLDTREIDEMLVKVEAEKSWGSPHDARLERLTALGVERMKRPAPPREKLTSIVHGALVEHCDTRSNVLTVLRSSAPLVIALGGPSVALGVVQAIRRVGEWWV